MYHDYFDDSDASGLRNPYGPAVPLLPEDRGGTRQRLLLLGIVGAGLSVAVPAAGGGALPGAGRVVAAPDSAQDHRTWPKPVDAHHDGAQADDRS